MLGISKRQNSVNIENFIIKVEMLSLTFKMKFVILLLLPSTLLLALLLLLLLLPLLLLLLLVLLRKYGRFSVSNI
jgi:hypothetical protein